MIVVHSLAEITRYTNSVVTVGTFDGVHLAHQEIIRDVVGRARMKEGRSVVVTFEPHPKEVLRKAGPPVRLLATIEERERLIHKQHVDVLFVIDFTYEFSRISAQEFFERYVVNGIGVSEVVVGYDHMFGRDRTAGIEDLVQLGQKHNFSVSAVQQYRVDGEVVSSTLVRTVIAEGDVERAARLLGYTFALKGSVVQGDGRGKTIGFPTANIRLITDSKIVPGNGVYFVGVLLKGRQLFGMMNIGVRPTIQSGGSVSIEVHIFELTEDIYGEVVEISFLRKLREEQRFASLEQLTQQLNKDKETSLRFIAEFEKRQ